MPASARQFERLPAAVTPLCNLDTMTLILRGIELRYVLTWQMTMHGPASIDEIIDALRHHGFGVDGRPSKAISDALRWEIGRGRVYRLARGRYGPAIIPRGTEHRIYERVMALREKAATQRWAAVTSVVA